MTIGEIATRFGLATHVLRHWESVGLLKPPRAEGGQRRYGPRELYLIACVLSAKEAGLALDDIRELVLTGDPAVRQDVLRRRRAELARQIAEARTSLDLIDGALNCDYEDFADCPNFQARAAQWSKSPTPA
jgi:DNA-binding transcriptional MerR regulator